MKKKKTDKKRYIMVRRAAVVFLTSVIAAAAVSGCSGLTGKGTDTETSVAEGSSEIPKETEETEEAETDSTEAAETKKPGTASGSGLLKPEETTVSESEPEEPTDDSVEIIIASDLHYLAEELTDKGENFTYMVEHGDGKLVNYIWELTDAFVQQVIKRKPDALVLSGDLSFNGELLSHRELAVLLEPIEEAGIPIAVIPGNHDINCTWASFFDSMEQLPAAMAGPADFEKIYRDYGYGEAVSRDEYSLSYTYQLTDTIQLMMLDSCQYEPENKVGGVIRSETYTWMEEQLMEAWNQGMTVLPVAHHNLLEESQIYTLDCTIEHSEQLIDMLDEWGIPLFLSGHLHVQHYMNSQPNGTGIYEIVTSSLATPPCQYGVLNFNADGTFRYYTEELDIEAWAKEGVYGDENLLNFKEYRQPFLENVFYNQAYDTLSVIEDAPLGPGEVHEMSAVYARLNSYYYAGKAYEIADEIKNEPGYVLWQEYGYPTILMDYVQSIIQEAVVDYNYLEKQ